jgi:hypothetical protein
VTANQYWTILGLIIVAVGIGLSGTALVRTHAEHGTGPLFKQVASLAGMVRRQYRRLFPVPPVVVTLVPAEVTVEALPVRAVKSGPPFLEDASVDDQLRGLREWLTHVDGEMGHLRKEQKGVYKELRGEFGSRTRELRTEDQRIRELVRSAVASTIRIQVWGLILVGMGTATMAVPALFKL